MKEGCRKSYCLDGASRVENCEQHHWLGSLLLAELGQHPRTTAATSYSILFCTTDKQAGVRKDHMLCEAKPPSFLNLTNP